MNTDSLPTMAEFHVLEARVEEIRTHHSAGRISPAKRAQLLAELASIERALEAILAPEAQGNAS